LLLMLRQLQLQLQPLLHLLLLTVAELQRHFSGGAVHCEF
jgi:hypothetical protein